MIGAQDLGNLLVLDPVRCGEHNPPAARQSLRGAPPVRQACQLGPLRRRQRDATPACPSIIPPLPGWEDRSLFITRERRGDFSHDDPYAQALAKIERGHERDRGDVRALIQRGLVEPSELRKLFHLIVPALHRYPALDPDAFARKVDEALSD